MIIIITPDNYQDHEEDLKAMYNLRERVITAPKDEVDEKTSYYVLCKDKNGILRGCNRFIGYSAKGIVSSDLLAINYEFSNEYTEQEAQEICNKVMNASVNFLKENKVKCFWKRTFPDLVSFFKKYFKVSILDTNAENKGIYLLECKVI